MKPKILIIDDAKELVEVLGIRLESEGYQVLNAFNGVEGIERAEKEIPDLILLDLGMPDMDGYTMLKELRRRSSCRSIPIIVVTGRHQMKDLMMMEGVQDFISKPYKTEELLDRIAWQLKKNKSV